MLRFNKNLRGFNFDNSSDGSGHCEYLEEYQDIPHSEAVISKLYKL